MLAIVPSLFVQIVGRTCRFEASFCWPGILSNMNGKHRPLYLEVIVLLSVQVSAQLNCSEFNLDSIAVHDLVWLTDMTGAWGNCTKCKYPSSRSFSHLTRVGTSNELFRIRITISSERFCKLESLKLITYLDWRLLPIMSSLLVYVNSFLLLWRTRISIQTHLRCVTTWKLYFIAVTVKTKS